MEMYYKMNTKNDTSVIIAAAGSSTRMNGTDKLLSLLDGIPVLVHTLLAFEGCESVAEIIVSARESDLENIRRLAESHHVTKLSAVVAGGNTRQESVVNGLHKVSKETAMLCIHDGARPLVLPEKIEKVIADARVFGGATLGVPVKDTIKIVSDGIITDTPHRPSLFAVQTPQVFKKKVYFEGVNFAQAHSLDFTDDCQLCEAVGAKVYVTVGDYSNLKITTPEDLLFAEAILSGREASFI